MQTYQLGSVQSLSRVRLFATPWIVACQASLSITNSWSSLKLMSIKSVMPSSHLIVCHILPPIPPSIRVFSNESTLCMRWPMYWSFSFSNSPSKEHTSRVLLKILQARLQQYINCELPDIQAGLRKGRGTRDQIANIHWTFEKSREFQ